MFRITTVSMISYEISWLVLLNAPRQLYFELVDQPAMIIENTIQFDKNNWTNTE